MKQLIKMQSMLTSMNSNKSIADVYPSDLSHGDTSSLENYIIANDKPIHLYDVVYASITEE